MAVNKNIIEEKQLVEQLVALREKLAKSNERIAKLQEKDLDYTKKYSELVKQNYKLQQDEFNLRASIIDKGGKAENLEKTLLDYQKQKVKSQEQSLAFENEIIASVNKHIDAVLKLKLNQQDLFDLGDMQKELLSDIAIMTGVNNDLVAQSKAEYKDVVDVNKELLGVIDKTLGSVKNVGTESFTTTSFDELISKINELKNTSQSETLSESIDMARELANEYKELADQLNYVNETAISHRARIQSIGNGYQEVINKINGFIKKNLPGGGLVAKLFGFDTLGRDFKQNLTKNFNSIMMEKIAANPTQAPGFGSTFMSAIFKTIRQLFPRLLAFVGAAFGAAVLFFMNMFDKLISKIVKDMGITRSEAAGLVRDTQGLAAELGASSIYAEQLLESANKIREGLGGIDIAGRIRSGNLIAKELVKTGAVLSDKFDLSGEEIGGLALTGVMFNKSLTQTTNITANMAKGVRSVKDAMKDMANIPARISAGFAGSVVQLAAMVNKAKLLGTSVESIRNMSESLLDIESSVSKQFEAQVLTGKQMDFDKARYFSLMGREDLAFEESLSQVGSLKEFKGFTPIAQKTIAEAAGFDVEEMSRILGRQELIQKLGISKQEFDDMLSRGENIATLIERRKQEGLVNEEDYNELRKLSEEYDSTTILEKLKRMAITLGNALSLLLEPLVNYLRDFMSRGGDNLIRGIAQALVTVAQAILSFASLFGSAGGGMMLGAIVGGVIGSFFGPTGTLVGMGIGAALGGLSGAMTDATAPGGYSTPMTAMQPAAYSVSDDRTESYYRQQTQGGDSSRYLESMAASLQSIDQQTRAPATIRIGEKSIAEIGNELSLKRNMAFGLDNTYDTTVTSNYRA
jgi:hypothetical protein